MKPDTRGEQIMLIHQYADAFAFMEKEIPRISSNLIFHELNFKPRMRPIKKNKRSFSGAKDKVIKEEVNKFLKTSLSDALSQSGLPIW